MTNASRHPLSPWFALGGLLAFVGIAVGFASVIVAFLGRSPAASVATPESLETVSKCEAPAVGIKDAVSAPFSSQEVHFSSADGHAYNPNWSADGKYVAFEVVRYDGASIDLYIASMNRTTPIDAVKVPLWDGSKASGNTPVMSNPTWHPNGISVFEGSNQEGTDRLYVYALGEASATELLNAAQAPGDLTFPTMTPDGRQLAFVSSQTGNGDLRIWNRTTNKITQLTNTEATESFPEYSANCRHLLFTRQQRSTQDLFELDLVTNTERAIVSGSGDQTRPIYAADGSIVYFTSERGADLWDIATVDKTGSNKRVIAEDVRLPLRQRPALTPDGRWVAWVSADPTKDGEIALTRLDGTKTVEIPTEYRDCSEPAFTLQNGRVLLAFTFLKASYADWRGLYVMDVTDSL